MTTTLTSTPRALSRTACSQMSTTDLLCCMFPVGDLIEQGLTSPQVRIICCVPAIVCSAACSCNSATDQQYAVDTV